MLIVLAHVMGTPSIYCIKKIYNLKYLMNCGFSPPVLFVGVRVSNGFMC